MNYREGSIGNGGGYDSRYQNNERGNEGNGNYGRSGYNLQYNAGNMTETGLKAKLYKLFCKEQEGFYGYMKLAQGMPEYQDDFIVLAQQEYNNAERVSDIYEEVLGDREQGRRGSYKESMKRDLEKMEEFMEKSMERMQ